MSASRSGPITTSAREPAAVTGAALRTPLGVTAAEVLGRLAQGVRAASPNTRFDARSYPSVLAAMIPSEPRVSRHRRFLRRLGLLAVEVAEEALAEAGVAAGDRLGLFAGVGGLRAHWDELMPALAEQRPDAGCGWERGLRLLHPFFMLQHLSNNAHALISIDLGARGEGATFGGANAGAQALAAAHAALEAGAVDAALVVAYDSLIEPETIIELASRGATTRAELDALAAPYGAAACGFVPGEAAAALVLERRDSAGRRASFLVAATDGADGTAGEPRAATLAAVAGRLLGGRPPAARSVAVVDGASRALPALDAAERDALAALLGDGAQLSSIASATGHLGAATSLVQAIVLAGWLERGQLAPVAGLRAAARGPLRPLLSAMPTTARSAIGVSTGAPGLAAAVWVERA